MKMSFVIVMALALFSLCTASPLLVTKHVVRKALIKGGISLLHHHHSKGLAKTVQEVHYVAVPPPVHTVSHVPVALPASSHHHGYKHY